MLSLDRCQIPYLFLSTSSEVLSFNAEEFTGSPAKFDNSVDAQLAFDAVNKQLYLYSGGFTSYNLDGSNSSTIARDNVDFFTVDGRNKVIYYHHRLQERIRMYNITSGGDSLVADLSDVASVKDLDMDVTNG